MAEVHREELSLTRAHWESAKTQAHLAGWAEARGLGLEVHESDAIVDAAFDAVRELFGEWARQQSNKSIGGASGIQPGSEAGNP